MHHLSRALSDLPGFSLAYPDAPYLWEAVISLPGDAEAFSAHMRQENILPGIPLTRLVPSAAGSQLLVACTEYTTPAAIDAYAAAARSWRAA